MFYAEIQFMNTSRNRMFATRQAACNYARDLLDMFNGEEMWFDDERKTYIVTAPHLEIVK